MRESRVLYGSGDGAPFVRTADIVYGQVDGEEFRLDLYRPTIELESPLPVVVFVHGDGPPEALRDIKDSGQYVSWGELIASTGYAAVTFNHRSSQRRTRMLDVASDIDAALECIQGRAAEWKLDSSRVGLWSCSMGVPFALRLAFERASSFRCVVALYGPMDLTDDPGADATLTAESRREFSPLYHLRAGRDLPALFLSRAGRDQPALNASIDAFVASALERNLEIEVFNHPAGEHAFDVRNDCRRTRDIIEATLHFYQRHL
jgi:acetyl esterase/lipase